MNSQTTYWLCRKPGAPDEGPFTMAQLRRMYDSGAVTAEAIVRRDGQGEWTALEDEVSCRELVVLPPQTRQAPPPPPPLPPIVPVGYGPPAHYGQGHPMGHAQPMRAMRVRKRVHTSGSGCASLIFLLLGLMMLVLFFPLGLILIAVAVLVNSKYAYVYHCGACGNSVTSVSNLCPTCRADLN